MDIRNILVPLSGLFAPDDPVSLDVPALQVSTQLAHLFGSQVEVLCALGPAGAEANG
ncbi:hypothetical protein [Pseudoprimorskyibacter insulae]|uniref:Uncharacterized protein n=1 Tax=Pseudoprimorskyibacter insulae TaxID=1695997 RepID=A0A2R8APY6_9RHOB|nr:hypothetical protein [Pseudoprimorskyibacter insulae]SPF78111.1 hypothetical protein PRI8871_00702 [Pseudoprimorskyibacter insulae]